MSESIKCQVCESAASHHFNARILNKFNVKYFLCDNCRFLQTEKPFWIEEAYRSPINVSDTGILSRNISLSNITSVIMYFLFKKNAIGLDYAGGYGLFVRLMRDKGFNFHCHDPHTENLFARYFEYDPSEQYGVVTCFEAFEHFVHPLEELEKILSISRNVIFSTFLLPSPVPEPDDWWYYDLDNGQHISFYSRETLRTIAKKYNLFFYSCGYYHMFSSINIPEGIFKLLVLLGRSGITNMLQPFLRGKKMEDMYKVRELMLRNDNNKKASKEN
jgi:hypothetical protein